MNRIQRWIVALLLAASPAVAADTATADDLAWLTGCWASEGGEAGSGEHWMPPAGGTLVGVNRTVRDGRTVAWEFLRIAPLEDGRLAYIAHPSDQQETPFALLELSGRRAIFENLEHDFPQRVTYSLEPDGRLVARIEGTRGGQTRGHDFPMRRTSCLPSPE